MTTPPSSTKGYDKVRDEKLCPFCNSIMKPHHSNVKNRYTDLPLRYDCERCFWFGFWTR